MLQPLLNHKIVAATPAPDLQNRQQITDQIKFLLDLLKKYGFIIFVSGSVHRIFHIVLSVKFRLNQF